MKRNPSELAQSASIPSSSSRSERTTRYNDRAQEEEDDYQETNTTSVKFLKINRTRTRTRPRPTSQFARPVESNRSRKRLPRGGALEAAISSSPTSNLMILSTRMNTSQIVNRWGPLLGCLALMSICLAATSVSGLLQQQPQQQQSDPFAANVGVSQLDPTQQLAGSLAYQQQQQPTQLPQGKIQHEISIEPNRPAKIECRLPPLVAQSNRTRQFYWNFQRTSIHDRKPDLLCYGTDCINAATYGIDLDFDQASGTYDLLISNASYELNDGIYYCDYRDTSPEAGGRQSINREIRLTILIPPQPPSIMAATSSPAREGQEYQLQCQSYGGNPEPNITWFKNHQVISGGPGVHLEQSHQNGTTTSTLTWIPTIDDHQASYKCSVTNKAMGSPSSYERELILLVEYAPRISVGPHNPLKVIQGERAVLSCQVDANPPVKGIRWYRDGHQLISNQFNHTIQEVKVSDASLYSCQADNGIAPAAASVLLGAAASPAGLSSGSNSFFSFLGLNSGTATGQSAGQYSAQDSKTLVEARLQLEVLYAPRVQIRESHLQPLNDGDHFVLNCSVDSWPPAHEFVWTKQEDAQSSRRISSSSSPTLEFQTVTASDMGNYTCTAYNRLEPSMPAGQQQQQQQIHERHSSASFMLLVKHKPGLAEILVGQNGETELGNKTTIQCRAKPPGYPEPKFTFWRYQQAAHGNGEKKQHLKGNTHGASTQHQQDQYTIFSAKPEDEGRYGCSASNELGQSNEALGELMVNEPPTITLDKTWRDQDDRQPGYVPYSITVRASGKPEPRVSWFHRSPVDGRRVELSSSEFASKFRIETTTKTEPVSGGSAGASRSTSQRVRYIVISTLNFKQPLEIDDRGLYSVEFSNGLSKVATKSHQLHINHAPIPALRNMPIVSNSNAASKQAQQAQQQNAAVTRAGFNLGETVNLTCRVSAYPRPEFVWYSQPTRSSSEKSLVGNPRYRTSLENPRDDIWEGTLSFELTSLDEYGEYLCTTANILDPLMSGMSDTTKIVIKLGEKTPPEPPFQVEQIDATQDSVTLQWVPGFDGGFAQNTFLVQYAPEDTSGLSLMRRFGPLVDTVGRSSLMTVDQQQQQQQQQQQMDQNSLGGADQAQQQQQYPKLYDCLSMNPCTINNLQPRQAYLMRLRARNELGVSEFSDELRVSTRANISQLPSILGAHFDATRNKLHFRVEPNPDYVLNNLELRIEVSNNLVQSSQVAGSFASTNGLEQAQVVQTSQQSQDGQQATGQTGSQWRRHSSMPVRHEQSEAYLNMSPDVELLRLSLCSRLNESLCGQEFLVGTHESVASSFLQDQRGLSMSIFASVLFLIVLITIMATTLHTRCLSRKAKKAAALDRVDHTNGGTGAANGHHHHHHHQQQQQLGDSKPSLTGHINGGLSLANGQGAKVGSHGSTTSTNSTSAGPTSNGNGAMQSMDSINNQQHLNLNGGSASDHSSDHSRQAKMDSMLPPNYSHYADRASLMLEQQQQQQQAYMQDKLSSPFGLPASALLGDQMGTHQIGDYFGGYGQTMTPLEQQQAMDANQHNSMMMNSVLGYDTNEANQQQQQQQQQMYATNQQALVDDYNYNALAYQQDQQQMIESAYGTTTGVSSAAAAANASGLMMAQPTRSSFDNSANQTYLSYPQAGGAFEGQQQHQTDSTNYQQDLAAAQQQMYGTLQRGAQNSQQASAADNSQDQQYMSSAGLMPPPPLPPPQESDYGTTGGARTGGRLIREIIV